MQESCCGLQPWAQQPQALGRSCEDLKRFPQTSEIRNILANHTLWQNGKFHPLNIFLSVTTKQLHRSMSYRRVKNLVLQTP